MDPKATAKTKRIHSQQGRKAHPTPASSAQKKATQAVERERHRRSPVLPTNWDRYDDDGGGGGGGGGGENPVADRATEVAPKSKGADFAYLVEQARSQPQESRGLDPALPSSDELLFDFVQGSASLLSIKGEGLLSWCQDDNFIVDDDVSSNYGMPFLSMDLHALADQLSKLEPSRRLFIEEELLLGDVSFYSSENNQKYEVPEEPIASEIKDEFSRADFLGESMPEKNTVSQCLDDEVRRSPPIGECQLPASTSLTSELVHSGGSELMKRHDTMEYKSVIAPNIVDATTCTKQKGDRKFKASTAEADLDMLLSSFNETSLSSFHGDGVTENIWTPERKHFGSFDDEVPRSASADPGSSMIAAVTSLDDALDDLLAETSLSFPDKDSTPALKLGTLSTDLHSRLSSGAAPVSGSNFMSQTDTMVSPGDSNSIDDLLAEASIKTSHEQGKMSSSFDSHSKHANDFDAWFGTL